MSYRQAVARPDAAPGDLPAETGTRSFDLAKSGGAWRESLVAGAGGVIAGLAAATILIAGPASRPASATLDAVAAAELSDASLSLDQTAGKQALDEARQCKVPLAYVTLVTGPGDPPARIRIRSGAYLSPSISITNAPRRVAIPFPAPYASGQGVISIEGTAQNLNLWLAPVRFLPHLAGTDVINVVWTPKNPC